MAHSAGLAKWGADWRYQDQPAYHLPVPRGTKPHLAHLPLLHIWTSIVCGTGMFRLPRIEARGVAFEALAKLHESGTRPTRQEQQHPVVTRPCLGLAKLAISTFPHHDRHRRRRRWQRRGCHC